MEEVMASSADYILIIIQGLFGLTTIMLVVFSLISDKVTKKTCGFSLINLARYSRFLLLLPIVFIFIIAFVMMLIPECNNPYFLLGSSVVILAIIVWQTCLCLQPLYNEEKSKKAIIGNRVRTFRKRIKKSENIKDVESVLAIEEKELFNFIDYNNVDNNYINFDDKKNIFESYNKILNEKQNIVSNENLISEIINIGVKIFGEEFAIVSGDYGFQNKILFDAFLNANNLKFSISLYKKSVEMIHSLFEENKTSLSFDKPLNESRLTNFFVQTINNSEATRYLVEYIFDAEKWNYADISFIALLLKLISNSFDVFSAMYKKNLDIDNYTRLEETITAYRSDKKLDDKANEFNKRFNKMLKGL